MSFKVEWDNLERSVLRYTVIGAWSWEEFYTARERGRQLADAVAHQRIELDHRSARWWYFPE